MNITVTEQALQKMKFFLQDKGTEKWGIRIVVKASNDYAFSMVELENAHPTDQMQEHDGVQLVIDEISARFLDGATIDFVESDAGSGFKVEKPVPMSTIPKNLTLNMEDPLTKKVHEVIEKDINPGIASHGGVAHLRGLQDNVVYLEMGGGCQGCAQSVATLRMGIETRIKEIVPEILEVVDVTDHSLGENPYY